MSDALRRAGLEVLGTTMGPSAPFEAWQRVIRGTPTVTVDDDELDRLVKVDAEWRRLAAAHCIVDQDGVFLIQLPGPGATNAPWTVVRLTPASSLAELADESGDVEFVTAARDGSAVLGVTSEEYGTWLVARY